MIGAPITRVQIAMIAAGLLFAILKIPLYGRRITFLGFDMSFRRYLLLGWTVSMTALLIIGP